MCVKRRRSAHILPLLIHYRDYKLFMTHNSTAGFDRKPSLLQYSPPLFASFFSMQRQPNKQKHPMGGDNDDDERWVEAARVDDGMVAELLIMLLQAPPRIPPSPLTPPEKRVAALTLEWTVRQRRSKSVYVNVKQKVSSHRASPTTPLSCTGATSSSGGSACAGSEETSRRGTVHLSTASRSKGNIDGEKCASKRTRKKKTLVELKDEESSLLKERRALKKEMAALRLNLDRQRLVNENMKIMKTELLPSYGKGSVFNTDESTSSQLQHDFTASHPPRVISNSKQSSLCPNDGTDVVSDSKFALPDLNIPFYDPTSSVVCGFS